MIKKSLKKNYKTLIIYIVLIMLAFLISLENYVSPTNTTGYIATDVSVWISVAKKMAQGEIMYRDFFDHKGPILYFIYYIGYTLGKILGIWFIDFLCNIVNVLMIYKISNLILKNKEKSLIITIICMCFMSGLCTENPCTESISLPCILIALYQFVKFMLDAKKFNKKESLCTGICFGIVLLLRPNIAALWVVYYIYIFIKLLKEKDKKHLYQIIGFSILGVIIVLVPTIFYLIKNGAFTDFMNTYLLFNLKYANHKDKNLFTIIVLFFRTSKYIIPSIAACYIGLISARKKLSKIENELILVSFIYFIFSFSLTIMPQRAYIHYLLPMLPTFIMPLIICMKYIKINKEIKITLVEIFLIVYLLISIYNMQNNRHFNYLYENISKEVQALTKKDDNVLVLGNNATIYLIADREYKGKYLYQTPIANENEDIAKEVIEEIRNDLPNVIVNTISKLNEEGRQDLTNFEREIKAILNQNYTTKGKIIYVKK